MTSTAATVNALIGGVLRSPFAHARISRLDTSKAWAVSGVKAVVTAGDFPDKSQLQQPKNVSVNLSYLLQNLITKDKVFYEGQPIVAIAAEDEAALHAALSAIDIEYAVLPHVIDVQRAMEPEAPLLHEELFTAGIQPPPRQASNVAARLERSQGQAGQGLAKADIRIAEEFTTEAVYSGGVELPFCEVRLENQGQYRVTGNGGPPEILRPVLAALLDIPESKIVTDSVGDPGDIATGNLVNLEPFAILLAQKSQQAVVMQTSREDVFRSTGAMPGSYISMRLGADRQGAFKAAEVVICMQAGAFPGAPLRKACEGVLAAYQIPEYRVIAYDVVVNRPMVTDCSASAVAAVSFALESLLDELARKLAVCPIQLRLINARSESTQDVVLDRHNSDLAAALQVVQSHSHYSAALAENQGRGFAAGYLICDQGQVVAPCTHICDVEVDSETGQVRVLRYTAVQATVEECISSAKADSLNVATSNIEAGVCIGLGRALNEAYVFDENGRMINASFLDYRLPLACDMPEVAAVFAGDRDTPGVAGEALTKASMLPPLAAVANAIADATSARITSLPMSLPVVLAETQRQKWKKRLRRR